MYKTQVKFCVNIGIKYDELELTNKISLNLITCRNYVVQFILKLNLRWATEAILKQLEGNYGDLSMQKYSSNVVEKCLQFAGGQITKIVLELINDPRFDKIMQDPYGNYAIQTALNNTEVSRAKITLFLLVSMFMYEKYVHLPSSKRFPKKIYCLLQVIVKLITNVVVTMLAYLPCQGTLHTKLVEAIRPHVPVLRMSPYGKKVLAIVGKSN